MLFNEYMLLKWNKLADYYKWFKAIIAIKNCVSNQNSVCIKSVHLSTMKFNKSLIFITINRGTNFCFFLMLVCVCGH